MELEGLGKVKQMQQESDEDRTSLLLKEID